MNVEFNMARVADQSERYEDIVYFLRKFVQDSLGDASSDVRNLLSVEFKNLISSQRFNLKTLQLEKAYAFLLSASFKSKKGRHILSKSYESGIAKSLGTGTGPDRKDEAEVSSISEPLFYLII